MSGTGFYNTTFTWDDLSRLTSHTVASQTMSFRYDFAGRRIMQQLNSNVKRFFIFDGDTMIGNVQGNNVADFAWTWGALGPIALRKLTTNASLWYDFGPQGETRHLTNSYGNIVDTYLYSSYGVKTVSTGPDPTGLLFGGQFGGYYSDFNTNAGVIYCRNRWYHPRLGRWLSRDPIGYSGGDNLYAYCDGDPVSSIDASGLIPAGHHYFPHAIFSKIFDKGSDVYKFFDQERTGPLPVGVNKWDKEFHIPYNEAVKEPWDKYIESKGPDFDPKKMGIEEAKEFLGKIKTSKNPAIRKFLDHIAKQLAKAGKQAIKKCEPWMARKAERLLLKKLGGAVLRKIGGPLTIIGFFLWDWHEGGAAHACNQAVWPVSELWGGD